MASTSQKPSILPGRSALHRLAYSISSNPNSGKPGLVFSEIADLGKINLRADKSARKIVKSLTGCTFPPAANNFSSAGERHVVWLGPDEFLIICEVGKDDQLANSLFSAMSNQHFAVTNITDALVAFHLKGPSVRQALAKGCAIDLHQNSFTPGSAVQTLLSHATVIILALPENDFIVICRTSFAPYLHDWLFDAALEYGVEFAK